MLILDNLTIERMVFIYLFSNFCYILVQRINYASGKNEWKMMPEDYDYTQVSIVKDCGFNLK